MTVSLEELEKWFQDRPKWLQDAACRLVQNGSLTDQDCTDLLSLCIQEASRQTVSSSAIPTGSLRAVDTTKPFRLECISGVQGVNALSPSKPLPFGTSQMCIVYGRNGAGKSGYIRLLKHSCGARRPGNLLGNVFETSPQPQTANITFTEDTQTMTSQWSGPPVPELQGVEIYDVACGLVYINEENEVAFEPWLLRFFTQLTSACTTVGQLIQKQIEALISKKPPLPAEYAATTLAMWYSNLSAETTKEEVEELTAWTGEHEIEFAEINRWLAEPNPTAKAAALRRQKVMAVEVYAELKKHFEGLSDERCTAYLRTKADAVTKRKAADEAAMSVFEKAPLAGVGSETWRLLWDAARRYSEEYAYKSQLFPNVGEGAHCVLCQRDLDEVSRERFISFENFVKSELQRLATETEQSLLTSADTFVEVPNADILTVKMEAAGLVEESLMDMVINFASQLAQRRLTCLAADSMGRISSLPSKETLIQLIQIVRNLNKQARSYDKDGKSQSRTQLEQKGKELSAQKWLNQQHKAVQEEIARLKAVTLLVAAERLTTTKALSMRKSILTDILITEAYKRRFQNELKHLGASNLSIDLDKSRAEVGRVYHRLSLRNARSGVKTSDILSEGELRIVSLAAFLADTEGRGAKTPFIFDDPISSLDHVYEEATARRLVKLTEARQVIVFTHRLSFVAFLEKYSEKHKIRADLVCLSRYVPGEITDLPIDLKRTDKAVNALLNERIAAAKKAFVHCDAVYENEAKGLCHDVRVLLERIVEMDLLNEVVRRFSQEVNTKGRIHALAMITEDDCRFIDEYMTKYSRYEHSQPEESPVPFPVPDELEADIKAIAGFVEFLRKRTKS